MENRMILWLAALFLGPLAFGQATLQLPYQIHTLPNGLTVILHEDHSVPMVAVNVWYHVGSGYEKPGRTGFAHLFEHLMFEGSGNVAEGDFDNLLESVGGNNNGSTNTDRTNYYEILPSSALDIALFLESDRMGYLLNAMSPEKVDGQRDVVKNERRQSYENRPYGMSWIKLQETLYPKGHPYNWPTIGYMEDLTAASYEDVVDFFNRYYCPKNASLVIAGDIDPEKTLERVKYWFAEIPAGEEVLPPQSPNFSMEGPEYLTLEDKVQLPRLYLAYPTASSMHLEMQRWTFSRISWPVERIPGSTKSWFTNWVLPRMFLLFRGPVRWSPCSCSRQRPGPGTPWRSCCPSSTPR